MALSRFWQLYLFILTACLLCTDTTTTDGLSYHVLTAPVCWAFLFCAPTALISWRWVRLALQLLVATVVFMLCLIDCYCQEFFLSAISPQLLSTVLNTDMREAGEFFSTFVDYRELLRWRLDALLLLFIVFIASCFLRLSADGKRPALRWAKRTGLLLLLLCCSAEVLPAWHFMQFFRSATDSQVTEGLIFRRYHHEVPTPLHRFAFAHHTSALTEQMLDGIISATQNATTDSCTHRSPHIALIIGESYNKHHSALYGYPLPTTPRQQQRQAEGSLLVFTDVVSPWNITSNTFLDVFSVWDSGAEGSQADYPLFPVLFRQSGYHVRFFSNQFLLKALLRGSGNEAGRFFLSNKRLSKQLFDHRNRRDGRYDLAMVEQLEKYKRKHPDEPYTLDIIHLIGQHFKYAERYPKAAAVFTENDYTGRSHLSRQQRQTVMHYDNATRFNDEVVDLLLQRYEDEEAVVVYMADHGEEVYDELPVEGRLYQDPTAPQARQEFEVPLWIWTSEKYRERHPDITDRIRQAANRPFMTDALPQLLLDLAGIRCRWYRPEANPLSDKYRPGPRIIARSKNYDLLMK